MRAVRDDVPSHVTDDEVSSPCIPSLLPSPAAVCAACAWAHPGLIKLLPAVRSITIAIVALAPSGRARGAGADSGDRRLRGEERTPCPLCPSCWLCPTCTITAQVISLSIWPLSSDRRLATARCSSFGAFFPAPLGINKCLAGLRRIRTGRPAR